VLIVAGWLTVDPAERDDYVADAAQAVRQARAAPGCLDYAVTADSLEPGRIVVYERWESEEQLLAFRGSGPSDEQAAQIQEADVARFEVAAVGPA
jgi:quinol monooxygenase YgiN